MYEALNVIHYSDHVPGEGMHSTEYPSNWTQGKCSDEIYYTCLFMQVSYTLLSRAVR